MQTVTIAGSVTLSDGAGNSAEVVLVHDSSLPAGWCGVGRRVDGEVHVFDRVKMSTSGGRLAQDNPGVDPALFIVDEENRITDG